MNPTKFRELKNIMPSFKSVGHSLKKDGKRGTTKLGPSFSCENK
jgi:hypothetical protein